MKGCCIQGIFVVVEVLKVRLQLANATVTTSQSTMSAGLFATSRKIYQKEGIRVFYSGLSPAIVRGLFYGGVRLGIDRTIRPNRSFQKSIRCVVLGAYGPIKNLLKRFVTDDSQATVKFLRNVAAGCLSGSIAAVASNPVDLCKTKLQTKNSPYRSSFHVIRDVVEHHGVKGLWVGTVPAAIRTGRKQLCRWSVISNISFYCIAALTTTQCVTYDHAKRFWARLTGWGEGVKLHLGASLITGSVELGNTFPIRSLLSNRCLDW